MYYKRIKELREEWEYSLEEAATRLKIPLKRYKNIECGKNEIDSEELIRMAYEYQVTVDYILEITNDKLYGRR